MQITALDVQKDDEFKAAREKAQSVKAALHSRALPRVTTELSAHKGSTLEKHRRSRSVRRRGSRLQQGESSREETLLDSVAIPLVFFEPNHPHEIESRIFGKLA